MSTPELLEKFGPAVKSFKTSIDDQAKYITDTISLNNKTNASIVSKIIKNKNMEIAEAADMTAEMDNLKGRLKDSLENVANETANMLDSFTLPEEEMGRISNVLEENIGNLDNLRNAIEENVISLEMLENRIMDNIQNDISLYEDRIKDIENPEELGMVFGGIITENVESVLREQLESLNKKVSDQKSSLEKIFDILKDSSIYLSNILSTDAKALELTKEQLAREKEARIFNDESTEQKKKVPPGPDSDAEDSENAFNNTFIGGILGGIQALLTNVAAGGAAFMAASLGFRGWELPILERISSSIRRITGFMTRGITRIVAPMFRFLDPVRDAAAGTGRLAKYIRALLSPVVRAASGIARFLSGNGRALLNNPLFRTAGSFARAAGRILRPIGFLFSAFEGIQAFMGTEGTFYERLIAGMSAAIGDFFGAPLDMLRDLAAWALERFGFTNLAESLREFSFEDIITNGISSVLNFVRDLFTFDDSRSTVVQLFESLIDAVLLPINAAITFVQRIFQWGDPDETFSIGRVVMDAVSAAINWVRDLFSDPTATLTSALSTVLGGYESIARMLFYPIDMAVQWISRAFGWEAGEDFSLVDTVFSAVGAAVSWVRGLFSDPIGTLSTLWDGILDGASNLAGIMFAPIRSAFNWIAGRFNWQTISESFEEFSVLDAINDFIDRMREWVTNLLPPLPTAQEIGEAFYDSLPPWLQTVVRRVAGFEDIEDIANRSLTAAAERLETATRADEVLAREIQLAAIRNRQEEEAHAERSLENETEQARIREILDAAARGEDIFRRGEMGGEFAWWGDAEEGIAAAQARLAALQLEYESEATANLGRTAEFIAEQQRRLAQQEITSTEREQAQQEIDRLSSMPVERIAAETRIVEIQAQQAQRDSLVAERDSILNDDIDNSQQSERLGEIEAALSEIPSSEILGNQLATWMSRLEGFSTGSPGFLNFGQGTPVMLHGQEAVVPRTTPAGEFLANLFDNNWQPTFEMTPMPAINPNTASQSVLSQKTTMLANESAEMMRRGAPVVVRGGDNVNRGGDVYRGGDTNTIINNLVEPSRKLNHIPT